MADNPSISITPDLMAKRAWNTAATAAATTSATTASKAAAAGKQWVVTHISAGFATASAATQKVITIKKGTTATRYYFLPIAGSLNLQLDEDDWIVGNENELVSAELAASAVSDATGYVTISGFHIGVR